MTRIFLDSMLWIYLFEASPQFGPRARHIFRRITERGDRIITSTLLVGETLVGPRKKGNAAVERIMRDAFSSDFVEIVPFTVNTAVRFADIRAQLKVSPADAIHLACAAETGTDIFVSNDTKLIGKIIPGIKFIVGINTDLFSPDPK